MKRSKNKKYAKAARGILIFIAVSMLLPLFFASTAPQASAWIDSSWTRRRPVTITAGGNGMPENYQVKIFVTYNSDMQTDFDDLRFALADDTLLPYWVENYNLGENATVWVKVPFSLSASASQTIYMYYGNASAGSAENGDATFEFFDDFPGTSFDAIKWELVSGTASVANSELTVDSGTEADAIFRSKTKPSSLGTVNELRVKTPNWGGTGAAGQGRCQIFGAGTYPDGPNNTVAAHIGEAGRRFMTEINNADYTSGNIGGFDPVNYHIYRFIRFTDAASAKLIVLDASLNEIASQTNTQRIPTVNINVQFYTRNWDPNKPSGRIVCDWVRVRKYVSPEPSASVGAEEEIVGDVRVSNIQADNILIDRDVDHAASGVVTGTKLQADVEYKLPNVVNQENVRFVIYDKLDAIINNKQATGYAQLTDNKRRFFVTYSALDNTLADNQLGSWDVKVEAYDNGGTYGTSSSSNVFYVDDLIATQNVENLIKHRIRTHGTVSRVSGVTLTGLENVVIIDNKMGTFYASLLGDDWENIRNPNKAGQFYLKLKSENLDGKTDSFSYAFPNFSPTILSVTSSQALIDRKQDYAGSGAILTTTLTARIKDVDGRNDLIASRIAWRDSADVLVDNQDVWASRVVVDENTYDVSVTVNPPDTTLDSRLGLWDVWGYAADSWSSGEGWHVNKFTVADGTTTFDFSPPSPYIGWPLTVSGTISRIGATGASATSVILKDNRHGIFNLGSGNTWSKTYTITNAGFDENVGVSLQWSDGALDGFVVSSYKTNKDVKFEVWVRFEENYAVVPWVPNKNRPLVVRFEWEGGTHTKTLSSNPENIIVPTAGAAPKMRVKITDNDVYWRNFMSEYAGGQITLIIVGDYLRDDGYLRIAQYRFFLQDYTTQYIPPDGQMFIKIWVDDKQVLINADYWDAEWRITAWLMIGKQYYIWVVGKEAPLRLVGPIDAVAPAEEKTILVQAIIPKFVSIKEHIYWTAWRTDNNTIRAEYKDNLHNTTEAHVGIYDMSGNLMAQYQVDNEWFIITWPNARATETYNTILTVTHGKYGEFKFASPVGLAYGPRGFGGEGVGNPFNLPVSLATIAAVILGVCIGLVFDAPRAHLAVIAMALAAVFFWYMGWLPLPGGLYTVVLILVMAILFALVWGRRRY